MNAGKFLKSCASVSRMASALEKDLYEQILYTIAKWCLWGLPYDMSSAKRGKTNSKQIVFNIASAGQL